MRLDHRFASGRDQVFARMTYFTGHAAPVTAFPDGSGEWFVDKKDTRNATNAPARVTDIVINEIMYKPPDTQGKGEFTMEFLKYSPVPKNVGEELIKKYSAQAKGRVE